MLLKILLLAPLLGGAIAWAAAALWIDGPESRPVAGALALLFVLGCGATLGFLRPLRKGLAVLGLLWLAVLGWWLSLAPSNDREWLPDVEFPAEVAFDGDLVTIRNVRNFEYRSETDYDAHWEERTWNLSQITGVDLFIAYWGSPWIAHTIVSWQFESGPPLAVSIETRKETDEEYSAVRGFFRQFELYYVVGDERDLIRLRTNYRGDEVYLYRLGTDVELARAVLVDYLEEINHLAHKPRWYNAARHNCTTAIRGHVLRVAGARPWDWRVLVNGHLDQMLYEQGRISQALPFDELRTRSHVNELAQAADADPLFSERIRAALPPRP